MSKLSKAQKTWITLSIYVISCFSIAYVGMEVAIEIIKPNSSVAEGYVTIAITFIAILGSLLPVWIVEKILNK